MVMGKRMVCAFLFKKVFGSPLLLSISTHAYKKIIPTSKNLTMGEIAFYCLYQILPLANTMHVIATWRIGQKKVSWHM